MGLIVPSYGLSPGARESAADQLEIRPLRTKKVHAAASRCVDFIVRRRSAMTGLMEKLRENLCKEMLRNLSK